MTTEWVIWTTWCSNAHTIATIPKLSCSYFHVPSRWGNNIFCLSCLNKFICCIHVLSNSLVCVFQATSNEYGIHIPLYNLLGILSVFCNNLRINKGKFIVMDFIIRQSHLLNIAFQIFTHIHMHFTPPKSGSNCYIVASEFENDL